jgi:ferredoxin
MAQKGLIFRSHKEDVPMYSAAMFVIGIWEYHVNDLDADLVKDVNEYLPHISKKIWQETKTKHLRVVPISKSIVQDVEIASYEDAEELIRAQSKITVQPCICRKEHEVAGDPCKYPMEVCFSFGTAAHFYEENKLGRPISIEEALEILDTGRQAGLVIQPGNAQKSSNLCMCCGCCCQMLKNLKSLEKPAEEVHSSYFAAVSADQCTACGTCEERCHMDAIRVDATATINLDRCIGCGVCIPECPAEAIHLVAKDKERHYVPPRFTYQTYMKMAKERAGG